jgi:protein involved in plasmid replication-relaxation
VRTLSHMLAGRVVPDAYGVLAMPDASPLHILLELDRGTEAGKVLREKAVRYAEILPRSGLRDLEPLVILAVPSARRVETARAATASAAVPICVTIWSRESTRSVLEVVRHCASDARAQ